MPIAVNFCSMSPYSSAVSDTMVNRSRMLLMKSIPCSPLMRCLPGMRLSVAYTSTLALEGAPSADAFQMVSIDVDQLIGLEQRFDLRPAAGEQSMIFISAEIAETQMHDARWRRTSHDPIRKIRILAYDDQIMLPGKVPNLCVGRVSASL